MPYMLIDHHRFTEAARKGELEIVINYITINLHNGNVAEINKKSSIGKCTALYLACSNNRLGVVYALLNVPGIDINSCDEYDNTALYVASAWANVGVVKALLEKITKASDISRVNSMGLTAAQMAGSTEIATLINARLNFLRIHPLPEQKPILEEKISHSIQKTPTQLSAYKTNKEHLQALEQVAGKSIEVPEIYCDPTTSEIFDEPLACEKSGMIHEKKVLVQWFANNNEVRDPVNQVMINKNVLNGKVLLPIVNGINRWFAQQEKELGITSSLQSESKEELSKDKSLPKKYDVKVFDHNNTNNNTNNINNNTNNINNDSVMDMDNYFDSRKFTHL